MHELKNHRINSIIHLTQLARMFQSEVKPIKLNGKSHRLISIPVEKFLEFISPAISPKGYISIENGYIWHVTGEFG